MNKPKIGDVITQIDIFAQDPAPHETPITSTVQVLAVFDSLNEDWGDYGHEAMGQYDIDAHAGRKGDWYAVVRFVEDSNEEQGTWSCASYEVIG